MARQSVRAAWMPPLVLVTQSTLRKNRLSPSAGLVWGQVASGNGTPVTYLARFPTAIFSYVLFRLLVGNSANQICFLVRNLSRLLVRYLTNQIHTHCSFHILTNSLERPKPKRMSRMDINQIKNREAACVRSQDKASRSCKENLRNNTPKRVIPATSQLFNQTMVMLPRSNWRRSPPRGQIRFTADLPLTAFWKQYSHNSSELPSWAKTIAFEAPTACQFALLWQI
jgi:hypothetical protein